VIAHLVYGMVVTSDLDLGLPAAAADPDVSVERLPTGPIPQDEVDWLVGHDRTGDTWRSGRVDDRRFVLSYGDVAQFRIDADGSRVAWWADDLPPMLLAHLVLDHVLPQVAMRRGRLVLHAACLASAGGGAYGIVGESGRGKSTLAATLVACGHALLSDDCTVIDTRPAGGPTVVPAYPGLRLHPQSLPLIGDAGLRAEGPVAEASSKLRLGPVAAGVWQGAPAPLGALVLLGPPGSAPGTPRLLDPGEAVVAVLRHSFHLGLDSERSELISRAAALAAAVPVTEIHYPHTGPGLEGTVALIRRLVEAGP